MTMKKLLMTGVATVLLSSCATPPQPPLTADSLLRSSFAQSNAAAFDVAAFMGQMPDWLDIKFSDANFDQATGAMVIRDLSFALKEFPEYAVLVDRTDIWGGDVEALQAVMAGGVTDAKVSLFDRATLTGVRTDNWKWSAGALIQGAEDSVTTPAAQNNPSDGIGAIETALSYTIDKLVFDGLSAKSYTPPSSENIPDEAAMLVTMAGVSNAYALEGSAFSGVNFSATDNQNAEIKMSIAEGFVRGYDGGRTEYQESSGIRYVTNVSDKDLLREINVNQELVAQENDPDENKILNPWAREDVQEMLSNPVLFVALLTGASSSVVEIDRIVGRQSDVSGALSWLSRFEMPPITQTDLIDLGALTIEGSRTIWDGNFVYGVDRSEIRALDFHWLVPSNYVQVDSGFTMNTRQLMSTVLEREGAGLTPETGSLQIQQIFAAIEALGVETINGQSEVHWKWDGNEGGLDTGMTLDFTDLTKTSFGLNMDGPSLAGWEQIVKTNAAADVEDIPVFFNNFQFSITDDQLLDRSYAYAATQLGGGSAQDMRASLPSLVRLSGGQFAQLSPRIPSYLDAVATFLGESGSISLTANPEVPVSISDIQKASEESPQSLLELLNLVIEHQPN